MPINGLNNANPQEPLPGLPDYWTQFVLRHRYLAYTNMGSASEVTIFADAQNVMPNSSDRYTHMDTILAHCKRQGAEDRPDRGSQRRLAERLRR